jgi:hypothetical protein
MRVRVPSGLSDKLLELRESVLGLREEVRRIRRQERYLLAQMARARRQLEYYETLLRDLRLRNRSPDRLMELLQRG